MLEDCPLMRRGGMMSPRPPTDIVDEDGDGGDEETLSLREPSIGDECRIP